MISRLLAVYKYIDPWTDVSPISAGRLGWARLGLDGPSIRRTGALKGFLPTRVLRLRHKVESG